jgi:predicted amidohydrolase
VYVVLANRVGVEGGSVFSGGSIVVAPGGEIVARADDMAEDRLVCELSLAAVAAGRRPYSAARDDRPDVVARELARILEER